MKSRLFLLILLIAPFLVSAAEFEWRGSGNGLEWSGPTPSAACDDMITQKTRGTTVAKLTGVTMSSPTRYNCQWKYRYTTWSNPDSWSSGSSDPVVRIGDTCPPGTDLNPSTGLCDSNCSDTVGSTLLVRGPDRPIVNSNGVNYVASSSSTVENTCTSSCKYSPVSSSAGSCYILSGSTDTGYCNYIVQGTGESCDGYNLVPGDMSGGDLNPPPDPGPTDPPTEEPPTDDPCHGVPGYSWNGSTCVKAPDPGDGGGDTGGSDGGGSDGGGSDGGSDGGGSDGGSGDGSGDGSGTGGGSGDGSGEGGGEEEPPEANTGSAAAGCDAPPQSTGDPLLGAILRQQWYTMCAGEELTPAAVNSGLQAEGFTDADTMDGWLADNKTEEIDGKVTNIISGLFTSGPSSTCPVEDSIVSTKHGSFALPWTMGCPIFNVISAAIFFFAYVAAGWILFDALSGSK